jgi:DNA polymerase delta subunit 1
MKRASAPKAAPAPKKAKLHNEAEIDDEAEDADDNDDFYEHDNDTANDDETFTKTAINDSGSLLTAKWQHLWRRPQLTEIIDASQTALSFHVIDIDSYNTTPRDDVAVLNSKYQLFGNKLPVMRLAGATDDGFSVLCHVHGYAPFFYVRKPDDMDMAMVTHFAAVLESRVSDMIKDPQDKTIDGRYVRSIEVVQRQTVYHYQETSSIDFLKIAMVLPRHVSTAKRVLGYGIVLRGLGRCSFETFEAGLNNVMKFMTDSDVGGCNWVTLPAGKYFTDPNGTSTCQIEAHIFWTDLHTHAAEGDWLKLAPLRILSFDIECVSITGKFPQAEHDPVIQIASNVIVQGQSEPIIKNVFTLDTCAPISGINVHSFESETDLLRAWQEFFVAVDADIVTGYNIMGFDWVYLLKRAETLGVLSFPFLGRVTTEPSFFKTRMMSSAQMGNREINEVFIGARVIFDVFLSVQREYKLSSYSLNSVSAKYIGEQKQDMAYSELPVLQRGTAEDRRRIATYCYQDALLPQRLIQKLLLLLNAIEMSRVCRVPVGWLLVRGQSVKVLSQIMAKCRTENLVIPDLDTDENAAKFEGATVLEPIRGFYAEPIATLDFSSLYPSIIIAQNLCYTTYLGPGTTAQVIDENVTTAPSGSRFVKENVKRGIMPVILIELIAARKRAKALMKTAPDELTKNVLNGRQLALKISCNSCYGFFAATFGKLPLMEISSATTSFGREMILASKNKVEARYTVANGYMHDTKIVYGDTDSIMIKFGVTEADAPAELEGKARETWMLSETMRLAMDAADHVNEGFIRPISLDFEKESRVFSMHS